MIWQPGDRALCIKQGHCRCPHCGTLGKNLPGTIYTVTSVRISRKGKVILSLYELPNYEFHERPFRHKSSGYWSRLFIKMNDGKEIEKEVSRDRPTVDA